jgi:uroporphyrinogen-III decarboxylase
MSTENMTPKERIITAMRGGTPDRVPVQLGIFSIAPRMARGTHWDVYYYNKFDLPALMVEMVKEFGFDGYLYTETGGKLPNDRRTWKSAVIRQDDEFIVTRTVVDTPDGSLWQERSYPKHDQPTTTRGLIKTREDLEIYLKHFYSETYEWNTSRITKNKDLMGDLGAVAGTMTLPGLHNLIEIFDGKLETATYFCMDHPDLLEEYRSKTELSLLRKLAAMLEAKPDYIEISCSGLLTLSTPEWVRQFSLPTLKKATHMCRQAGIPSELHACGKARLLVEMAANETELDSVNPLQPPPMGDCDLAEIKHTFGKRLCIKGNVGVTEPMLTGTTSDVEKDVIRCLDAAKAGGAYILFTEEGLGRDTPFDNIRKFVEVGKALGKY